LNEAEKTATVVVQEDQLSLAIGRDGQNARLAAKLTGWRIDIKSLTEAAGDAIVKVQQDPEMAAIAEAEHDRIATIEEILTKKSQGRPLTPEEFLSLIQFVDRVERHTVEQKKATAAAEEERLSTARAGIPEAAFSQDIETLGLPDHVYTILTEAEHRTIGDLMMAMKLNPDSVLSLAGIGPKAMQAIEAALSKVNFPEPGTPAEIVAEEIPAEVPAETQVEVIAEVPTEAAVQPSEELKETVPATEEPVEQDEKEFEKIFSLQNVLSTPPTATDDASEERGKKKDKKVKKGRELEYDEKRGEVVARKKHKRGDEDLSEDWE
jgi:N utilization substance protein A